MATQSHIDKVNLQPMVIPYPTHVGAPKIEPQELTAFKLHGLNKVDRVVKRRFDELVKEAEKQYPTRYISATVFGYLIMGAVFAAAGSMAFARKD